MTYAADEPELRNRLMVSAPAGTAWQCLRCGACVTSEEHGSGPAAAAPLIRRGAEPRSELILRVFAVERFLRFLVIGAAAYGVWRFKYDRAGFQRVYDNALVIYLVWTRRLFGVRGGKVAYDARLRSESVIEVEQAALAAAAPGQSGPGTPADALAQSSAPRCSIREY